MLGETPDIPHPIPNIIEPKNNPKSIFPGEFSNATEKIGVSLHNKD